MEFRGLDDGRVSRTPVCFLLEHDVVNDFCDGLQCFPCPHAVRGEEQPAVVCKELVAVLLRGHVNCTAPDVASVPGVELDVLKTHEDATYAPEDHLQPAVRQLKGKPTQKDLEDVRCVR